MRHLPMHPPQFDRRKLTVYYDSSARINFRELVRHLYGSYHTRIWMKKVSNHSTHSAHSTILITVIYTNTTYIYTDTCLYLLIHIGAAADLHAAEGEGRHQRRLLVPADGGQHGQHGRSDVHRPHRRRLEA
jgi:hypothetical protein